MNIIVGELSGPFFRTYTVTVRSDDGDKLQVTRYSKKDAIAAMRNYCKTNLNAKLKLV